MYKEGATHKRSRYIVGYSHLGIQLMLRYPFSRFIVWFLCFLFIAYVPFAAAKDHTLRVGVTLHPYYSWVANIADNTVVLSTVIPANADPHSYQAQPDDLSHLEGLDCLVVNGLGHDDYIKTMLKALESNALTIIKPNKNIPLIADTHQKDLGVLSRDNTVSYNSHTYVSIIGATKQINSIADALGKLRPQYASLYKENARSYNKKLRTLLRDALASLKKNEHSKSIATVHDGYAYLFQELGITVDAVVQPRHGIEPSARQLADTIKRIKKAKVNVLFAEVDYKKKYVDTIYNETGCRIYTLSHISSGAYTPEKFEKDMRNNLNTIVTALTTP